jgi:hypothetical protein
MPITPTSISSPTTLTSANIVVTTSQDAVRQQMATAAAEKKSDAEDARAKDESAKAAIAEYNGLSAKDKADPKRKQKVADAQQAAADAKHLADQSAKRLQDLTNNALPAAILADKQATDANRAREKQIEDDAQSQEKTKADNEAQAAKDQADAGKTQGTGQTPKPAQKNADSSAVVGAAAAGAQAAEGDDAPPKAAAKAPATAESDNYQPQQKQPVQAKALYAGSGNSVLPGDEEESQARPAVRQDSVVGQAAPKPARTTTTVDAKGAPIKTTDNSVPTGGAGGTASVATAPTVGAPSTSAPAAEDFAGLVTDSGVRWTDLTDAQQAYIKKQYQKIKDVASQGDVEKTMKAMMDAFFDKVGQQSGVADTTGEQGAKTNKQQANAKGTGSAGAPAGAAVAGTATVGAPADAGTQDVTPAGNGALSAQAGATGASVGAPAPRQAVQGFVAPNTLGGSGKLSKATVGASAPGGSSATVGAAATDSGGADLATGQTDEISRGYFGGISPMELVQMVMLLAFKEAGEDVRGAAQVMQQQTNQKAALRASQDALRPQISTNQATGAQDSASKAVSDQMDSLQSKMDSIGDDNQIVMIRLQNLTQLLTTMSQATSNISKSGSDATKSIVGKIAG